MSYIKLLSLVVITINFIKPLVTAGNSHSRFNASIRELLIPSLFPKVPPYIRFPSHNESKTQLPKMISRHLVWKVNGPGVIHQVVTQAGTFLAELQLSGREIVDPCLDLSVGVCEKTNYPFFGFGVSKVYSNAIGSWKQPKKSDELFISKQRAEFNYKPQLFDTTKFKPYQKFRHFPSAGPIFLKSSLARSIQHAQSLFGKERFDFIPETFVLPQETKEFKAAWEYNANKLWIVKAPNLARGNGIHIINHPNQAPVQRSRVVQKYIHDTFTLEGYKSHMIVYAVITSIEPLRIYMRDDLVLTQGLNHYTTDLDSLENPCVHIPNYATFQSLSCNKGFVIPDRTDEERAKFQSEFHEMLQRNNIKLSDFMEKVYDATIKTILAGRLRTKTTPFYSIPFKHTSKYNAFHYMSLDFAIDTAGRTYLLEINHTPTLHYRFNGRIDKGLHKRRKMQISGALTLAGYHLPPTLTKKEKETVAKAMNSTSSDVTFNPMMYRHELTEAEAKKHSDFEKLVNSRQSYIDSILEDLTPDDVRHLILAEDELNRSRYYVRIWPSNQMYKYMPYIKRPYYYMLYDAFENKYRNDREAGRDLLTNLTKEGIHLQL